MDNKLFIQRINLHRKSNRLAYEIDSLDKFLNSENISYFKDKKSIKALEKMKKYLEKTNIEKKKADEQYSLINEKFLKCCKHEIMYKNNDQKVCILCDRWWYLDDSKNKERFNKYLKEGNLDYANMWYTSFDYYIINYIDYINYDILIIKIIENICENDENLLEKFKIYVDDYIEKHSLKDKIILEFHEVKKNEKERHNRIN